MNKKISLFVIYPPYFKKNNEFKIEIEPERAIDLIKKKYNGWVVVMESRSGKTVVTNLNEIRHAKSVQLYFPISGGSPVFKSEEDALTK